MRARAGPVAWPLGDTRSEAGRPLTGRISARPRGPGRSGEGRGGGQRGEVERPGRDAGGQAAGPGDVHRGDVEPDALAQRARLRPGTDDAEVARGEAGERTVIVAALDPGTDQVGVADLDSTEWNCAGMIRCVFRRCPAKIGEGRAHGLLERAEPERGGRAGRGPCTSSEAEGQSGSESREDRTSAEGAHR